MHTWLHVCTGDTNSPRLHLLCRCLRIMVIFNHLLLVSCCLVPLVLSYPFYPPTCYTKVLNMARELMQQATDLKWGYETGLCMAHMPHLYLDVHNACVMYKMWTYISLLEGLRQRRCAYTREVRKLEVNLRQLFIIMSEKCHGDLVFTIYDCAALER
ncbi:cytokine-like protein 1 [Mastacembelus armatus]|uniref:Zmp:0000001268 n=1 Tax=Mastacembelus armatus TaxID=205130 RepID=A0A7N8YAC8_9TELE|nr:cytokine-like protein 1 [Mastacembelus armatus]XP_026184944.1 cytokine-like protein 1 [Mastacembelus armatus]